MAETDVSRPRPGVDYPGNLAEFDRFFPDESACVQYLEQLRWPKGFFCPRCGYEGEAWRMKRGLLLCPDCRGQVSVTAGTIFEGTRKPLKLWFMAAWEITGHKYGANALTVQRMLGVRSYKTAWSWLHKFRRAMVRSGRSRLDGVVEVDETYVGGEEDGGHGRFTETKAIVAIALEIKPDGFGRVRLQRIPDVRRATLEAFVTEMVEPGSIVRTDAWTGYAKIEHLGYTHEVVNQTKSEVPAHVTLPGVHRVASLLKRVFIGTYHGGVSREHLDYYLDEYTFRRASRSRGLLFYRLLQGAVRTGPTPTRALFAGTQSVTDQIRQQEAGFLHDAQDAYGKETAPTQEPPMSNENTGVRVPADLQKYFWEYASDLTWEHSQYTIILRLLQSGGMEAITWLRSEMSDAELREFIESRNGRGISPRRLRFWALILNIPKARVDHWISSVQSNPWYRRTG